MKENNKLYAKDGGERMKIVFDSEEERKNFFETVANFSACPSDLGLLDRCKDYNTSSKCRGCWEGAVESEVKKQ